MRTQILTIGALFVLSGSSFAQLPSPPQPGGNFEHFLPINWIITEETGGEAYKTYWTLERDGTYKKQRIAIRGSSSNITLPGSPQVTTGTEYAKGKRKVTVTWNGPAGVPVPTKVYLYCYAEAHTQPGTGTLNVGLPRPKIATPADETYPMRRHKNGDAIRELTLSGGSATTEIEGRAEVTVEDTTFSGGRGADGRAEWGGFILLTNRALSLTTQPAVTYEPDPNAPIVQLFPPAVPVKNENMDDIRIVTAFGSDGYFSSNVGAMPVGLWDLPTTQVSLSGGDFYYHWGNPPGKLTNLVRWADVYVLRKSPSPKKYTVTGTATDQVGASRTSQVEFEVHAPLEEFGAIMEEPAYTPWVERSVYISGPSQQTVTHSKVRSQSETKVIGHSLSLGVGADLTEFAKLSYNASAEHKIGFSVEYILSDSQSETIPANEVYPGTTSAKQYSIQIRDATPRRTFRCRAYNSSGYVGRVEQTVDLQSSSHMRKELLDVR